MKKFLLISLMTINIPILSMLRTQQVVTLLFNNRTTILRTMSTLQLPKNPPITTEEIKKNNLPTIIAIGAGTIAGTAIGSSLNYLNRYTMEARNTNKELMTVAEESKENNNDSDHD